MGHRMRFEAAVFSGQNALTAQRMGANRVELNAPGSYSRGGLTPPLHELSHASPHLAIPVRVMIRPAGEPNGHETDQNFQYTPAEHEQMLASIRQFKESGLMNPVRGDGFVFGVTTPANERDRQADPSGARLSVDVDRCSELVGAASPYPCVFHRAFDPIAETRCREQGLSDLIDCGFKGVLTSGGRGPHHAHLSRLDAMACWLETREHEAGLQLIVGGGLRSGNAARAVEKLGTHGEDAVWLHSACLTGTPEHPGEMIDDRELGDVLSRLELAVPE